MSVYLRFLAGFREIPAGLVTRDMAMVFKGTQDDACPRANQSRGTIDFLRAARPASFWHYPHYRLHEK
jgi:hypothetical protein